MAAGPGQPRGAAIVARAVGPLLQGLARPVNDVDLSNVADRGGPVLERVLVVPGGAAELAKGMRASDDEDGIRHALNRFLSRLGYRVLQAASAAEALDQQAADLPHAMLSDIRMPNMTGVELVPKALAHDSDLAIIMLTAIDEPRTAIECLKLGAYDYLTKPVDPHRLRILIDKALERQHTLREVQDLIHEMQRLDPKRFPGNPELVEQLHTQVLNDVDKLELQLRRQNDEKESGEIRSGNKGRGGLRCAGRT